MLEDVVRLLEEECVLVRSEPDQTLGDWESARKGRLAAIRGVLGNTQFSVADEENRDLLRYVVALLVQLGLKTEAYNLVLSRRDDLSRLEHAYLDNLAGLVAHEFGDNAQAADYFEDAFFRGREDPRLRMSAWANLARVSWRGQDSDGAIRRLASLGRIIESSGPTTQYTIAVLANSYWLARILVPADELESRYRSLRELASRESARYLTGDPSLRFIGVTSMVALFDQALAGNDIDSAEAMLDRLEVVAKRVSCDQEASSPEVAWLQTIFSEMDYTFAFHVGDSLRLEASAQGYLDSVRSMPVMRGDEFNDLVLRLNELIVRLEMARISGDQSGISFSVEELGRLLHTASVTFGDHGGMLAFASANYALAVADHVSDGSNEQVTEALYVLGRARESLGSLHGIAADAELLLVTEVNALLARKAEGEPLDIAEGTTLVDSPVRTVADDRRGEYVSWDEAAQSAISASWHAVVAATPAGDERAGLRETDVGATTGSTTVSKPRRMLLRHVMRRYRTRAIIGDSLSVSLSALAALLLRFRLDAPAGYYVLGVGLSLAWIGLIAFKRGYDYRFLGEATEENRRILDSTLVLFSGLAILSYLISGEFSRAYVGIAVSLTLLLTLTVRHWLRDWLRYLRENGIGLQQVLIVGQPDAARSVIDQLDHVPSLGLVAVGVCIPDGLSRHPHVHGVPVVGDFDRVLEAVEYIRADIVALASFPYPSTQGLEPLSWALEDRGVGLMVSPAIVDVASSRLAIRQVAGLPLLHLEPPTPQRGKMLAKAIFDRLIGAIILILLAPTLVAISVAIKVSSRGPVLFRQKRVGMRGREFTMLKFRSMVVDAESRLAQLQHLSEGNGVLFKLQRDPRVTRVGAVLRRYSLDELPQLINVVKGDMSLVGPRPPLPAEVAGYTGEATRRLRVRPGLTGLWQVSGRYDLSWEESLRLDLRYVDNWSLALDLTILWRTWRAVVAAPSAY